MPFTGERVQQITAFLENRPGILADLCAHLSDHDVNIRAMTTRETGDRGAVQMVVDRVEVARQVLADAGVPFEVAPCLAVEMPNAPGGLARIARVLALAGINIDFIYASTTPSAAAALGVFGVSDLDRAVALDWDR